MADSSIGSLLDRYFGPWGSMCWELLPFIDNATAEARYSFMAKAEHDELVKNDPLSSIALYWNETIQRVHLGCCASLLRHRQWLRGMAAAAGDDCFFAFFASYRGFLESVADSTYSLAKIPFFLADHLPEIVGHINKRPTDTVFASYDLENRLIHFSHGRRLAKGETADPVHAAKQMREYMQALADVGIKAHELYSALCGITHPSAETVALWYSSGNDSGSVWLRGDPPSTETVDAFMREWRETNVAVFQMAFVPLFFNLKILHKFEFLPKIPKLKRFPFSRFPAWLNVEKALRR